MELNPYNEKLIKSYTIRRLKKNKETIRSELKELETELEKWKSLEATNRTSYPGRKMVEEKISIQEILVQRLSVIETVEKKIKLPFLVPVVSRIVLYFKSEKPA